MVFQMALLSQQYFMQMTQSLSLSHKNVHVLKGTVNSELANVEKWMRLKNYQLMIQSQCRPTCCQGL